MANDEDDDDVLDRVDLDDDDDGEGLPVPPKKSRSKKDGPKKIKGKEKVAIIIAATKAIMKTYGSLQFKMTLRQLHYRLVEYPSIKGTGMYENTINEYKWLSNCLAEARRHGEMPWEIFEDKTRTVPTLKKQNYDPPEESYEDIETDVTKIIDEMIQDIENKSVWYSLPANLYQPELAVVMLEKQALENVFKSVIDENKAVLVVNKGYNSLTQLKEFADILKKEKRQLHLKCFSDFDPSGVDIQRNFVDQMIDLGIKFKSVERIALTEEIIRDQALPYAPTKTTDARAKNWRATGVVELDAVDPVVLRDLIKKSIAKHWNEDIHREVKHLEKVLKRRIKRECSKKVAKIREQIVTNDDEKDSDDV